MARRRIPWRVIISRRKGRRLMSTLTLVNGVVSDCIPVSDRGLGYGHGLFETVRIHRGQTLLWERHLARLQHGASRLCIPLDNVLPRLELWRDDLLHRAHPDSVAERCGVLKLVVTAGTGERGYALPAEASPAVIMTWQPGPSRQLLSPARLRVCTQRLAHQPALAGIKHLNRLEQVLARAEWQGAAWDEGITLDQDGAVVECTSSNLFMLRGGRWYTPALERAGVAGVMRDLLLTEIMPACGQASTVVDGLRLDDLEQADEVFICNAITGVRPVAELEQQSRWSTWPVTDALRTHLSAHYEYASP